MRSENKIKAKFLIYGLIIGISFTGIFYEARNYIQVKAENVELKEKLEEFENKVVGESVGGGSVEPSSTESTATPDQSAGEDTSSLPAPGIEKQILDKFTNEYKIALAIARAESGLRPDAQGFNCRYNGVSQACRKGDEYKAWSTDCGLYQINVPGTTCPAHLLDPAQNIQVAFEKYQKRKWQPWCAFTSGKYLAYL